MCSINITKLLFLSLLNFVLLVIIGERYPTSKYYLFLPLLIISIFFSTDANEEEEFPTNNSELYSNSLKSNKKKSQSNNQLYERNEGFYDNNNKTSTNFKPPTDSSIRNKKKSQFDYNFNNDLSKSEETQELDSNPKNDENKENFFTKTLTKSPKSSTFEQFKTSYEKFFPKQTKNFNKISFDKITTDHEITESTKDYLNSLINTQITNNDALENKSKLLRNVIFSNSSETKSCIQYIVDKMIANIKESNSKDSRKLQYYGYALWISFRTSSRELKILERHVYEKCDLSNPNGESEIDFTPTRIEDIHKDAEKYSSPALMMFTFWCFSDDYEKLFSWAENHSNFISPNFAICAAFGKFIEISGKKLFEYDYHRCREVVDRVLAFFKESDGYRFDNEIENQIWKICRGKYRPYKDAYNYFLNYIENYNIEQLEEHYESYKDLRIFAHYYRSILFVCQENTDLSPLCEGFVRFYCQKISGLKLRIDSSALSSNRIGSNPGEQANQIARNCGFDISGHVSKPFKDQDLKDYELIVTVTKNDMDYLKNERLKFVDKDTKKPAVKLARIVFLSQSDIRNPGSIQKEIPNFIEKYIYEGFKILLEKEGNYNNNDDE